MRAIHDVPAPAKLNLFLHITGRRPDGYHLIESAFVLIDWCDTLHFEFRPGGISRADLTTPLPADDLILKAAKALKAATGCPHGAHISVAKSIPAQAGMGGGSSDAATCLLALNRLWALGLNVSQLTAIGVRLGADVPFFLSGGNGWVQGIGEEITPLTLDPADFIVVKPAAGLSTQDIFSSNHLVRDTETAIISGFAANPFRFGRNDLQPVAEGLCSEVGAVIAWLDALGLNGRMTGSGSAVFAHLNNSNATKLLSVQQALHQSLPAGWVMRQCRSLQQHPLAGWAG